MLRLFHTQIHPSLIERQRLAITSSERITSRTWLVMTALDITGQIAWAVENSWFNTFVYDTITPDPRPVARMVAASAITATWMPDQFGMPMRG